jgi:hypothetical protein
MSGHKPELELCSHLNDKHIDCGIVQLVNRCTDLYKRSVQGMSQLSSLHPLGSTVGPEITYLN